MDQEYYNQEMNDAMQEGLQEDDDYLKKEREIKELNDLRIRTLERLVKEKVDIIHQQESEISINF
jgi:hypothetical protein